MGYSRKPHQNRLRPTSTEKNEERIGDQLMTTLGFSVWKLSQPRATMQTTGWPDRLYMHRTKKIHVFWEAKRVGGRQRDGQKLFEADAIASGINYVCGPSDALLAWCVSQKLCSAASIGSGR